MKFKKHSNVKVPRNVDLDIYMFIFKNGMYGILMKVYNEKPCMLC